VLDDGRSRVRSQGGKSFLVVKALYGLKLASFSLHGRKACINGLSVFYG
jgi:hypothetical protein